MPKRTTIERNRRLCILRWIRKNTYQDLAGLYGISPERVRQVALYSREAREFFTRHPELKPHGILGYD